MSITTITSREFNQDTSRAKRASQIGPVFITDRGQPAHVLLSFEEYMKLANMRRSIGAMLAMPGVEDIEFEAPSLNGPSLQAADFD